MSMSRTLKSNSKQNMNHINQCINKQPKQIKKIVNQLTRLKKQLKLIKSTQNIPLLNNNQNKDCSNFKISKNRSIINLNQKNHNNNIMIMNKIKLRKQNQSKLKINNNNQTNYENEIQLKQRLSNDKKKLGNQLDMSKCKSINKSYSQNYSNTKSKSISISKSNPKSQSKSKSKNKNIYSTITNTNNIQTKRQPIIIRYNDSNSEQQNSNQYNKKKQQQKTILKRLIKNNVDTNNRQNNNVDNLILKSTKSYQNLLKNQNKNNKTGIIQNQEYENKNNQKMEVSYNELDYRLRTVLNYQPQFISIYLNKNQLNNDMGNINQKQNNINQKENNRSLKLKGDCLLNGIKKSLLRYPNYHLVVQDQFNQISFKSKQLIMKINQQSANKMSDRFTQYIKGVECQINRLINWINSTINSQNKYNKNLSYQNEQQLNEFKQQINTFKQQINTFKQKQITHKNKIKKLKFIINQQSQTIKQKQNIIKQLQFRYVLNLQLNQANRINLNSDKQEQNQLQALLKLLQEQNKQLQQKGKLLLNKLNQRQIQLKEERELNKKINNQIVVTHHKLTILQNDVRTAQIMKQSYQQNIQSVNKQLIEMKKIYMNQNNQLECKLQSTLLRQQKIKKQLSQQISKLKNQLQHNINQFNQIQYELKNIKQINFNQFQDIKQLRLKAEQYKIKQKQLINKLFEHQKQIIKYQQLKKQNDKITNQNYVLTKQIHQLKQFNQSHLLQLKQTRNQLQKQNIKLNQFQSKKHLLEKKQIQMKQQINELKNNIDIIVFEMQRQSQKNTNLETIIQKYKHRAIKAELQLKQYKFLNQNNNKSIQKQQKVEQSQKLMKRNPLSNQDQFQEIRSIIISHQYKLQSEKHQKNLNK